MPPAAVTAAVPFVPPIVVTGVDVADAVTADGCAIVTDVVAVQPLASVTVNVYVPAVLLNVPVPVYGAVPPVALTVTVDEPPLHKIAVADEAATTADAGCVIVTEPLAVHPAPSVTVTP